MIPCETDPWMKVACTDGRPVETGTGKSTEKGGKTPQTTLKEANQSLRWLQPVLRKIHFCSQLQGRSKLNLTGLQKCTIQQSRKKQLKTQQIRRWIRVSTWQVRLYIWARRITLKIKMISQCKNQVFPLIALARLESYQHQLRRRCQVLSNKLHRSGRLSPL